MRPLPSFSVNNKKSIKIESAEKELHGLAQQSKIPDPRACKPQKGYRSEAGTNVGRDTI